MKKIIPLILVLVTLASLKCLDAEEPRRMALVIGNSEYTHKARLPNAVNDADAVTEALTKVGFSVTKKLNRGTRQEMELDIDEFIKSLRENDVSFVFYAGHGLSYKDVNYLLPVDVELSSQHHIVERCMAVSYLKNGLNESNANLKVLVLDACRSEEILPAIVRTRGGSSGMVRERAPRGMIIAFSTAPGQVALDGDGNNSPYTKHLVATLSQDYPAGLTLDNLFRTTGLAVFKEEGQEPFREMSDATEEFYVKKPVSIAKAANMDVDGANKVPNNSPNSPATLTNSIGMKMNLIPAGKFMMGSPAGEEGRGEDETQHDVEITRSFYMATTEVTQSQWQQVMGATPWKDVGFVKEGGNYAVTYVSWDDAIEFCEKLSRKEGETYRLPTEAEWEYACRGNSKTAYSFSDSVSQLVDYGWFDENAWDIDEKYSHQVGQKKPNGFGLFDMHGNVYEWCADWYDEGYYKSSPKKDPLGPSAGSDRVLRGGGWNNEATKCRSAGRFSVPPSNRYGSRGFRVVQVH